MIEQQLNKRVDFLAWPGGGNSSLLQQLAQEAGYKATTKGTQPNLPGVNPSAVQRGSACFGLHFSQLFLNFQMKRLSEPSSLYARSFEWLRRRYKSR